MAMECLVSWTAGVASSSPMGFIAETGSGHCVVMDGAEDSVAPDFGGRNLAPRPMELLLAGMGGCTAYDIVLMLRRGRHRIHSCQVQLKAERAATDPKVFTNIHLAFAISGEKVPSAAIERAIALSHDKYCSASIMIGKTAAISTSFVYTELA